MDWMKCTAVELGEKIKAGEVTAMEAAMAAIRAAGETPYVIGAVEAGEKGVTVC